MVYQVELPVFAGPLDLLLHLIEENKIDIYNIPIAQITQQYLDYLDLAGKLDLELTSEFLVMACTLLSIKAKMLLPEAVTETTVEEENDPREELVQRLLEYKKYKEKAQAFQKLEERQSRYFWREINEAQLLKKFPIPNPLGNISWEDLVTVFHQVLARAEKKEQTLSLNRERVTVEEKIDYILSMLQGKPAGFSFNRLVSAAVSKEEIIVTFLALLELIKLGIVFIQQNGLFKEIYLFMRRTEEGQVLNA